MDIPERWISVPNFSILQSEKLIGRLLKRCPNEEIFVALELFELCGEIMNMRQESDERW